MLCIILGRWGEGFFVVHYFGWGGVSVGGGGLVLCIILALRIKVYC